MEPIRMSARNITAARVATAALAVALVGGCADDVETADREAATATGSPATQTTDVGDITRYELRMEQVDKYFAAFRNIAAAMQRMTPEQRARLDMDAGQTDLDGYIARLEREPEVDRAIRDAGLSAREFSLLLWSMLQSGMASAVLQARPNANEDSLAREMNVNMANVRFMLEHDAALRQKQQALEAEMRAMGLGAEADSM
jgi:hypothetical protein